MNIREMPAGREMDALVAEKVMGYTYIRESNHWFSSAQEYFRNDGGSWLIGKRKYFTHDSEIPYFSTSIADAWLVVEKMRQLPSFVSIIHDGMMWVVTFENGQKGIASDFSAPLAICRAALLAVEGEKE